MKLLKKIMAGALSLAVVVGAAFAFTGCNSVKGKTYAYSSTTFTIVMNVDEEGKVTETKTLSAKEYWMIYEEKIANLENYTTVTLTEDQEKAFKLFEEGLKKSEIAAAKYTFTGKEIEVAMEDADELTGEGERMTLRGTYTIEDDVINAAIDMTEEGAMKMEMLVRAYLVDGNIEMRDYEGGEDTEWTKEGNPLYYTTVIFAEVK